MEFVERRSRGALRVCARSAQAALASAWALRRSMIFDTQMLPRIHAATSRQTMMLMSMSNCDARMKLMRTKAIEMLTIVIIAICGFMPAARALWWMWLLSGRKGLRC